PDGFAKVVGDVKPKTEVDVVVLRKGKRETLKGLSLPEKDANRDNFPFNVPKLPQLAPPALPPVPNIPAVPGVFGAAGSVMTPTYRNGDGLTTRHQEGPLVITVTGTVTDGKTKVSEIQIHDGRETNKYESADKVPEQYRDKVKGLLESADKSNSKLDLKPE